MGASLRYTSSKVYVKKKENSAKKEAQLVQKDFTTRERERTCNVEHVEITASHKKNTIKKRKARLGL